MLDASLGATPWSTAALTEKKGQMESTKGPQLHALAKCAADATAFLVEQHRKLQMALYRVRDMRAPRHASTASAQERVKDARDAHQP